jgi:hypothetical protein
MTSTELKVPIPTIDRSMETDEISKNSYELLHFVLDKIRQGISAQLMSVVVLLKLEISSVSMERSIVSVHKLA